MTLFGSLAASPVVLQAGWMLVHFLWQGAGIAALLAVALLALRRGSAQTRYAAACAALLGMAACPLVTLAALHWRAASDSARLTALLAPLPPRFAPQLLASGSFAPLPARPLGTLESLLPAAVVLWCAGVLLLTIRALGGWLLVRRLCRTAHPVGRGLGARAAEMARAMGIRRGIDLRLSARIQVPSVVGCVRAVILFPVGALAGLPTPQLEALLAHELAHVRRHNYLVNLIQTAVETLLFYHPAVWWVTRRIRAERENCCDDIAVAFLGDRRVYASALASLEELGAARLAMAAAGGELLDRIRRILGEPIMQTNRPAVFLAAALALALASAPFALPRVKAESPRAPLRPARQSDSTPAAARQTDPFADRIEPARSSRDQSQEDVATLKAQIRALEAENAKLRASLRERRPDRPAADALSRREIDALRDREMQMAKTREDLLRQSDRLRAEERARLEVRERARRAEDMARLSEMDARRRAIEQERRAEEAAEAAEGHSKADRASADLQPVRREASRDEIRALREENRAIRQQLEELRRQIEAIRSKRGASAQAREKRETALEQQRYDLQRQMRQMRLVYSPNHPKLHEVQGQIEDLDRQLAEVRSAQDRPLTPAGLRP